MRFQPKIVYGATTLNMMFSMKPWSYISKGIGGSAVSKNGIPEAFEIRRDYKVTCNLVFFEAEWASVEAWAHWAQQTAQSFQFYFDKNGTTYYLMYLESPAMEEDIAPLRSTQYLGAFELPVTLRSASGALVDVKILEPLVPVLSVVVSPSTLQLSI